MIYKIMFILFWAGLFLFFIRWITQQQIKYQKRTERQFAALAKHFKGQIHTSDYRLQRNRWQPPEVVFNIISASDSNGGKPANLKVEIYMTEIHRGKNWTPLTITQIPLPPTYLSKRQEVLRRLRKRLNQSDLQLYRLVLEIQNDYLYVRMPLMLYNEKLRVNYQQIIEFLRLELGV